MASTKQPRKDGVSLAKGPVGLLGLAMLAFGVLSFLLGDNSLTSNPVDGAIEGDRFLGVEGNGWTNLLWIAGGALLAFGAPFHWAAKTMALIVGLALGAASVIAMIDGETVFRDGDVLGIFAANNWTILLWGASSAYLLISSLLPKVGKRDHGDHGEHHRSEHEPRRTPEGRDAHATAPAAGVAGDHARTERTVEPPRDTGDHGHSRETATDPQAEASRDAEGRRL